MMRAILRVLVLSAIWVLPASSAFAAAPANTGSLPGALVGSLVIGLLYNFGQARFPDLAYVILFLPMVLVLVVFMHGSH